MRKHLSKIYIIFGILLFLLSCSEKKETVFRMPVLEFPVSYAISASNVTYTNFVLRNIHDTLIERKNLNQSPGLAEQWYSSGDGLITFKLRDNLYYSDGTIITTEDVKNTYKAMKNHPLLNYSTILDSIVTRENNYLDIYTRDNLSVLNIFLATTGIFKTEDLLKGDDYFNNHSFASTGVYYVHSRDDVKITLKKNVYHRNYKENKDAPDIVELILQPDLERQYQKLTEDIVDFVQHLPVEMYNEVFEENKYQVIEKESNIITYMALNATGPASDAIRSRNSDILIENPLKIKKVRQAIAYAIDTKSFIKNTLYNKAYPLVLPILSNTEGYPTDKECYKYDLDLSKALMKDAGLEDGFEMTIQAVEGKFSKPLALFIQESLYQINIDVKIDFIEFAKLNIPDENQVASIHSFHHNSKSPVEIALRLRYYFNNIRPHNTNRYKNYNPRLNELFNILRDMGEYDDQKPILRKELTDIIYDEAFIIPLINPFDLYLLNKKFTFVETVPMRFINFKSK